MPLLRSTVSLILLFFCTLSYSQSKVHGKVFDEIGVIMGITTRTVKAHIQSLKEKLNCITLFQLGAKYSELKSYCPEN